jgi:hypothetical protein
MKNPTKPFGTAGKRKIQPVKPGMKFDNMDAFGAAKVTGGKKKIAVPPQYRVKKRKP